MNALRLYGQLVSASLRAQMQYKVDFLVSMAIDGLLALTDFLLLAAIMLRFREIGGWNVYEIGLLYGMAWIAMSLYRTFAPELNDFERHIVQGTFDSLLIRPWPTLLVLLSRNVELRKLGGTVQGACVFVLCARALVEAGTLSSGAVAYMVAMALFGTLIPVALSLATATCAFWIGRSDSLTTFTMYAPITASQYPLTIFPGWLRALLTSILPVAFINFIPVQYLLGKGGSWISLVAAPVAAVASFVIAYRFWRLGERHYHSTGS